jgi:hypothetical protein
VPRQILVVLNGVAASLTILVLGAKLAGFDG